MSHTLLLPSQPQLVLIYRPRRDERLSRPWCEVAQAEIRTRNLPIANPALYHTATSAPCGYRTRIRWVKVQQLVHWSTAAPYRRDGHADNKLCGRPPQYAPAPASWPLTFWPWKRCPSHVWRGLYLCANFTLPRPLCSRLRPNVRDRQMSNVRETDCQSRNIAECLRPMGAGA